VQNKLDRLHLLQDVITRMAHLGAKGIGLKQQMQDKLIRQHEDENQIKGFPGIARKADRP
jgi:xylulose-5-phosphate/fructose-6-phosphate phosphoketolase